MKTKKFVKKLTLNKNTIANLGNDHLGIIKGGTGDSIEICLEPTELLRCTVNCTVTCVTCTCHTGGLAFACCPIPTIPGSPCS
jgi:hypothetical protein